MKRALVGTAAGRLALWARERLSVVRAAWAGSDDLGMVANDNLAGVLVARLCRPGGTFVDVGAHTGSVVGEVVRRCPSSPVVACEAIPEKVEYLRRKFPGVGLHACAVGEAAGEVTFYVHTARSGYSSLGRPAGPARAGVVEIKVPVRRLDDLVPAAAVDIIKIDVEGAELGVFRGAERVVAAGRPTIMFESGPPADDGLGYTKEAMWDWLTAHEYAVLVPNRVAHNDPGLGRDGFVESHLYPRRTTNYFAVARERRDEVRDRARRLLGVRVV